jgi:predicted nucleotide-binding protein
MASLTSVCESFLDLTRSAANHLRRADTTAETDARIADSGTPQNVFIGHGRSLQWLVLRDFVAQRLKLPWDEFNRVPVAGVVTAARLVQMLDQATLALLVLTAEDETADGRLVPRQNVVHEAGLFQGRLGFARAIVLMEEGCESFSNIHGLNVLRFPRGRIDTVFEQLRAVLEWEKLLP